MIGVEGGKSDCKTIFLTHNKKRKKWENLIWEFLEDSPVL